MSFIPIVVSPGERDSDLSVESRTEITIVKMSDNLLRFFLTHRLSIVKNAFAKLVSFASINCVPETEVAENRSDLHFSALPMWERCVSNAGMQRSPFLDAIFTEKLPW